MLAVQYYQVTCSTVICIALIKMTCCKRQICIYFLSYSLDSVYQLTAATRV